MQLHERPPGRVGFSAGWMLWRRLAGLARLPPEHPSPALTRLAPCGWPRPPGGGGPGHRFCPLRSGGADDRGDEARVQFHGRLCPWPGSREAAVLIWSDLTMGNLCAAIMARRRHFRRGAQAPEGPLRGVQTWAKLLILQRKRSGVRSAPGRGSLKCGGSFRLPPHLAWLTGVRICAAQRPLGPCAGAGAGAAGYRRMQAIRRP